MNRRKFLATCALAAGAAATSGCRGHRYAHVLQPDQADLVGTEDAGAATFNPLIDESVAKLLARQASPSVQMATTAAPPPRRICFVGVENRSAEEIGDFKDQIYQQIDTQILQSPLFEPVSKRFVDAALLQTRLRPDQLYLPEQRGYFVAALEQQGQPFDFLLYATLTSGTTDAGPDMQRDYLLSLELVDIRSGAYDKESAMIRKGYHKTRVGKWRRYNPFAR